jgi:hypothetical protein
MIPTKKEFLDQYLYHEIENEEESQKYLDNILPLIGYVVMYFNGLEKDLDKVICENFTDRTDYIGLLVLHNLKYSTKIDLFKRFCDGFHQMKQKIIAGYEDLIRDLREAGRLRNLIVHSDWENTVDDGYTYVKLIFSKDSIDKE